MSSPNYWHLPPSAQNVVAQIVGLHSWQQAEHHAVSWRPLLTECFLLPGRFVGFPGLCSLLDYLQLSYLFLWSLADTIYQSMYYLIDPITLLSYALLFDALCLYVPTSSFGFVSHLHLVFTN